MPHLCDLFHKATDCTEELSKYDALTKPLQVSFGQLPLDTQDGAGFVFLTNNVRLLGEVGAHIAC